MVHKYPSITKEDRASMRRPGTGFGVVNGGDPGDNIYGNGYYKARTGQNHLLGTGISLCAIMTGVITVGMCGLSLFVLSGGDSERVETPGLPNPIQVDYGSQKCEVTIQRAGVRNQISAKFEDGGKIYELIQEWMNGPRTRLDDLETALRHVSADTVIITDSTGRRVYDCGINWQKRDVPECGVGQRIFTACGNDSSYMMQEAKANYAQRIAAQATQTPVYSVLRRQDTVTENANLISAQATQIPYNR